MAEFTKGQYEAFIKGFERAKSFNIFNVLNLARNEVRHSMLLAELLNPNGSHGKKDLFLKSFLDTCDIKNFVNTEKAEVYREYSVGDGRIDIYITDNEKHIIIENKIWAGEQERQVDRYIEMIKNKCVDNSNIKVLYLTLNGTAPSEQSCSNKEVVITISYAKTIPNWITNCIDNLDLEDLDLKNSLSQYKAIVKQITDKDDIRDAMLNNYESSHKICNNFESIKNELGENAEQIRNEVKNRFNDVEKELLNDFFYKVYKILKKEIDKEVWDISFGGFGDTKLSDVFVIKQKGVCQDIYYNVEPQNKHNEIYFGIAHNGKTKNNLGRISKGIISAFKSELEKIIPNKEIEKSSWWAFYYTRFEKASEVFEETQTPEKIAEEIKKTLNLIKKFEVFEKISKKINENNQ